MLISMLWHRQAMFESKGEKLSSSAEGRIRTHGLRYLFTSRLNACWQTDWAIEDQAKKLEPDSPSLWSASIQPTRPLHGIWAHLLDYNYFALINVHWQTLFDAGALPQTNSLSMPLSRAWGPIQLLLQWPFTPMLLQRLIQNNGRLLIH